VKHKEAPFLLKKTDLQFLNKYKKIKGLSLESFLFFCFNLNKTCIITDRETIEWAALLLKDYIPKQILCFLKQDAPLKGFDNLYNNTTNVSIQAYSNHALPRVCFVEEGVEDTLLLPRPKKDSFIIDKNCQFNALVAWLKNNGFISAPQNNQINVGEYYINGGIIDLRPFHSQTQIRISFLEDFCSIFNINKHTNIINKPLDLFEIFPFRAKEKESPLRVFKKHNFLIKKYKSGTFQCFYNKSQKSHTLKIQAIDYQIFIKDFKKHKINLLPFDSSQGFVFKNIVFIPAWFKRARQPVFSKKDSIVGGFDALRVGAVYIHEDFGMCRFLGLEKQKQQERVCLEFLDGLVKLDVHYVSKLSFFSEETNKPLHYLNRPGKWLNQKKQAQKEAKQYIKHIITTYAYRDSIKSRELKTQDPVIDDFVRAFKYQDTPDQALCWRDILQDFKQKKPMNRLVCGDVGFGKTEIAIRATFVSVLNGLSVVVLAPTTILAKQLQHSFFDRLNPFGVSVKTLSSLSENKEKNTIGFINKKIDVLIGTSALLFRTRILQSCGLFIVDEEHRFGVQDKERVLEINPTVNFLSLSATPIPRSLQLSLNKIRTLSLIKTPPVERKPILCFVNRFSIKVVHSAILKEIGRGGLVFFVDNSVENLYKIQKKVLKTIPDISTGIIYSKLQKKQLINNMDLFVSGKIQVLFSTTIIESGIDIGKANTIIINNAHLFGLSQLYQLRGRVGRSPRQAFAWFLFPFKQQTQDGKKRIQSIIKNTSLGSGYHIALSDLEIRGSGSLFGYKQSGGGGVGFEYYSKLISLASQPKHEEPCIVNIFNTNLEKEIQNEGQRGFLYKSVFSSNTKEDLLQIKQDFLDLFGSTPSPFLFLLKTQEIALLAATKKIIKIVRVSSFITITFSQNQPAGFVSFIIPFISSFFTNKKINFSFSTNKKNFTFQYKSVKENDYILLLSFLNKLSF
tara:strand:+ start:19969 stop:22851 length:2883 start_codon:yes stop_codon:yes gene_type:complete